MFTLLIGIAIGIYAQSKYDFVSAFKKTFGIK